MSAREEILRNLRGYEPREDDGTDPAAQLLDAYRAEVLREAADRLEAIDPIEFALGSVDPITELRRMARDTP